ncbi:hypothetical protein F8388_010662 [Cannabis sativa]|uniref:Uncharacterized protein n=1 Tax=Cannabis sativa TaxID=3483 RepID=A0A7J6G5F7_CANSA|nr:hypothetical protein G4B88_016462 [Cannabis sativa]KAF4378223.1 hypothetical protein F8388_010662 [Cannabis sativa]
MGNLLSHVVSGLFFLMIGLWHLYNHIKLHALHPKSYIALPWFPTSKSKYLELISTMVFCSISLFEELYLRPHNHQILNPNDGTLPYSHLAYMEHSSIFFTFFIYAIFAIILDCLKSPVRYELTLFLTALTYAQSFGGLHFHTADHMGPEGQYHLLFQVLLLVALSTTLLGIGFRKSFLVSFVRSLVVVFVGIWDIFMGVMLWTPSLLAKDCFLSVDEITGQKVVRCSGEESLHRAKSIVNLQFSWLVIGMAIFGISLYLVLFKIYDGKVDYFSLDMMEEQEIEEKEEKDYVSYDIEDNNKPHNVQKVLNEMLPYKCTL